MSKDINDFDKYTDTWLDDYMVSKEKILQSDKDIVNCLTKMAKELYNAYLVERSARLGPNASNILSIKWDPDDNVYIAEVPAWPGCITHSTHLENIWGYLYNAMIAWKESVDKRGVHYDLKPLYFFELLCKMKMEGEI